MSIAVLTITGGILFVIVIIASRRTKNSPPSIRELLPGVFAGSEFDPSVSGDIVCLRHEGRSFYLRAVSAGDGTTALEVSMDMLPDEPADIKKYLLRPLVRVERRILWGGLLRFLLGHKLFYSGSLSFDSKYALSAIRPAKAARAFDSSKAKPAVEALFALGYSRIDRTVLSLSALKSKCTPADIDRGKLLSAMAALRDLGSCLSPTVSPGA